MLEGPAPAVFAKSVIEQLPAHDGLPQDVEGRSGFAVGIGEEVGDVFTIGHDGLQLVLGKPHVICDLVCRAEPGLIIVIEFPFGDKLHKAIEPFVKPAPLPFIAIDDHGEIIVSYLVDDSGNSTVFFHFGISAVRFRPAGVEADHRVLHSIVRLYGNSNRIRVRNAVFRVGIEGMCDCFS